MISWRSALAACAISALCGVGIGWQASKQKPVQIVSNPAVSIKDGLRLETKAISPSSVPRNTMAKGQIKVKPKPLPDAPAGCACDEITVEYREAIIDGQPAMEVTSKDADVTGGYHAPIDFKARQERPWAVGITYGTDRHVGAFISRDLGPFTVGLSADADSAQARIGLRF
jgi:hypothetical protein